MLPNRESGRWLPRVEACPTRAEPCGNPADADEAMRAGQIAAVANGNTLAALSAEQALKNAHRIAKNCMVASGECPLEKHFGCGRFNALSVLTASVQ